MPFLSYRQFRRIRCLLDFSYRDMEERSGVGRQTIWSYENGQPIGKKALSKLQDYAWQELRLAFKNGLADELPFTINEIPGLPEMQKKPTIA